MTGNRARVERIREEQRALRAEVRNAALTMLETAKEVYSREVWDQVGRRCSMPFVQAVLVEMEAQGELTSRLRDPLAGEGGMQRRYYRVP